MTLRAPIDGVVLRRLRESEAVVATGEPLLEVADPAKLEIVSDLLSTDAVRVSPGDRALIEQWGGGATLSGVVRRVEPSGFTKVSALGVEEQRVLTIVDLVSPPEAWQRLGDGYRVEAVFVLWEAGDVLQLPQSALFPGPEGEPCAFVLDGEVARRRAVTVGQRNGLQAQVLDGAREGERAITHPPDSVVDGRPVRVR